MREDAHTRITTRERLTKEQNNICAYCKRPIKGKSSLDHIIPVDSLNDNIGEANLVVTCIACNKRKGNHIIFSNLFDKEVYPMIDHTYIYQDYYIHKTTKIR